MSEMKSPLVTVVLGSFNRLAFLKLTIESIREEFAGIPHELFVVDGGSSDGSVRWLVKQKDIISIIQHNRGTWRGRTIEKKSWGYFMNLAFRSAHGKYIFMLSDDCLIVPGSVKRAIDHFEKKLDEKVGALAFWWRHWPYEKNYGLHYFYGKLNLNHGLYLRQALLDVGFADEDTYTFYSSDVDIAYKMVQLGYQVLDAPDSYIEHYGHANVALRASNWQTHKEDNDEMVAKWENVWPNVDFSPENRWKRVEKEYQDDFNTSGKFWKVHFLNFRLYIVKLKNMLNKK